MVLRYISIQKVTEWSPELISEKQELFTLIKYHLSEKFRKV